MPCSHDSSIGLFYESCFLIFVVFDVYLVSAFCFLFFSFGWIQRFPWFLGFLIWFLLRFWGYLGFLFSWLSVSISLNLFSVSINEILDLCLLDSFFQGDFYFGVSSRFSVIFNCLGGGIIEFGRDSIDAWGLFLFGLIGGGQLH